jgi:hypothetical protein
MTIPLWVQGKALQGGSIPFFSSLLELMLPDDRLPALGKAGCGGAKRFFGKVLVQSHTVNPRTITVDKNPTYPKAIVAMKNAGEL